jgi:hypothetical protein
LQQRRIVAGIRGPQRIEIRQGLQAGEQVVAQPDASLRSGRWARSQLR